MNYELNENQLELIKMLKSLDKIASENNLKYQLAYGTVLGAVRHKGFIPWDSDIDIVVNIDHIHHFCEVLKRKLPEEYTLNYHEFDKDYDSLKPRISITGLPHHVIHIDIFPIVGMPKNIKKRKIFKSMTYLLYRLYFIKKLDPTTNYKNKKKKLIISKLLKLFVFFIPSTFLVKIYNYLTNKYPISNSDYRFNICGSYGDREIFKKEILRETSLMKFEGDSYPTPKEYDAYLTQLYGNYMEPKRK